MSEPTISQDHLIQIADDAREGDVSTILYAIAENSGNQVNVSKACADLLRAATFLLETQPAEWRREAAGVMANLLLDQTDPAEAA